MLPGLMRTAAAPRSSAATASRWSKCTSAMRGTGDAATSSSNAPTAATSGHGHPHQCGARGGERPDLAQGRLDVVGGRVGHRLDHHGGVAAHQDTAYRHLPSAEHRPTGPTCR